MKHPFTALIDLVIARKKFEECETDKCFRRKGDKGQTNKCPSPIRNVVRMIYLSLCCTQLRFLWLSVLHPCFILGHNN